MSYEKYPNKNKLFKLINEIKIPSLKLGELIFFGKFMDII